MALSGDARLLARVKRGDSSAFEALHARHQPAILAFCRHLTGNREDAEDAVQHTFLAAYRRIVESDDALELRPWLFAVARNRSLSLLRARRDRVVASPDAPVPAFDGLSAEVERREELRDLVCDMSRLPEPQRAALVLSQLDALSYREIGSVLEVPPEKVKALVFQARSSLASTREAREAPCLEIRTEIANARGSSLRRRLLRRHVGQCDGCREFEVSVLTQRRDLAILLPVAPTASLGQAILEGALGREGATTTAGAGGVAATGGGGLAGTLASLAGGGAAKLAVVAVVAGGGVAGAAAADLPARIQATGPIGGVDHAGAGSHAGAPQAGEGGGTGVGAPRSLPGDGEQGPEPERRSADGEEGAGHSEATEPATGDDAIGGESAAGKGVDAEAGEVPGVAEDSPSGLPPGLAKRDDLPPGLAKRDDLPPGLAKRDGAPPGNGRGNGHAGGGNGNANGGGHGNAGGQGNGAAPGSADSGQGEGAGGNANGNIGAAQGNGNAGGQGNSSGGNPGGQGNGNAGQGNSGGGQGNGNSNGNGNPH